MVCKMKGDMSKLLPVISFFLGAAMMAAFVFLNGALDVNWRLSALASWDNGNQTAPNAMKELAELTRVLRNASMEDNTVILTSINRAYAAPGSLLDLFLESFRIGEGTAPLLDHVLIVAMDPGALARCRAVHRHCYLLRPEDAAADYSDEKYYMTKDYLDMMWARNRFQQTILELGFNFLFTDVDIMWFRNPMRHIAVTSDIAIASDFFNGDEDSMRNRPNGGFLYARTGSRTVEFYRRWRAARERFPAGSNEQHVLAHVQAELSAAAGVRVQFLDTARCGGFCQLRGDMAKVCTLHANCCTGLANKVHDLRGVLRDWKNYTAAPPEARRRGGFQWTRPGKCIH